MNVAFEPASIAISATSPAHGAVDESALCVERPFPGLRPFGYADRGYFFGRERQTFALYRLVEHGRFVAVVGSSGSGKSSLVLAGLRRLLEEESEDPGGPKWVCLEMRPGASPLSRLARALARLSTDVRDEASRRRDRVEHRLRQSSFSLEEALAEAGGLGGRSLLLIIDQFEELFRFGLVGPGSRAGGVEEIRARDEATQFVQILLDADRRRLQNVRVLITMRSDFIGDCAYFHGLSEAVSATQYLVPNLTRGQIEDAIRKPIETAGGSIEAELVERLINDCGDERDQLPVLQHCLMRLWDRAGVVAAHEGGRRLTRQTYDEIGRMAEALSRHADEVLRQCAGKELAVEQAFRALSELDREGRAIRRALGFEQLLAETGVAESDLRAVLDRFRAPSCSFLLPSLSSSPTLDPAERIDIGHEALLRRWRTIAGTAQKVDANTGRPAPGWLCREQADGQRYRTLASMLDGEGGGEQATLKDPDRTKAWWESLPRTAAWADRYGGRFEAIKKLIDDSIKAKQRSVAAEERSRRNFWALAIAGVLIGVITVGVVARSRIEEARQSQEAVDKGAMKSAKEVLNRVRDDYHKGTINKSGAKSLASALEESLREVHNSVKTNVADSLWAESLDVDSDLQAISGNFAQSLTLAREAKAVALLLVKAKPNDPEALQLLFDSSIRVGDALKETENFEPAIEEYTAAMGAANALLATSDTEAGEDDAIRAFLKIGDIYKKREQSPEAFGEYSKALSASETAVHKFPQNSQLLRERGASNYRIAATLETQAKWEEAANALRLAEEDQKTLIQRDSNDLGKKSDLAATYKLWGQLARDQKDWEVALLKYQRGVSIQEELVQSDRLNSQWNNYLAPTYNTIAEMLYQWDMPKYALIYYQKSMDQRLDLVLKDASDIDRAKNFAIAAESVGDHSSGGRRLDPYRRAMKTWKRITKDHEAESIALSHYDDLSKFADTFVAAKEWSDAVEAYDVAKTIASLHLAEDPSDTSWRDKAERAAHGAEDAEIELAAQPVDDSK